MLNRRWLPVLYILITALMLLMLLDLGNHALIPTLLLAIFGFALLLEKARDNARSAAIELSLLTFLLLAGISVITDFQIILPQLQLLIGLLAMLLLMNSSTILWFASGVAVLVWGALTSWVFVQFPYRFERALLVPESLVEQYGAPIFMNGAMTGLIALGLSLIVIVILMRWIHAARYQHTTQALIASGILAAFFPGMIADLFTLAGFSSLGFIMLFSPAMMGLFMYSGWLALLAVIAILGWSGQSAEDEDDNNQPT